MSNERRIFYISVDKNDADKLIDAAGQFPSAQIKDFGNRPDLERLFASQREVVPADVKAEWAVELSNLQNQINLVRKGLLANNQTVVTGFENLLERHKSILEHHVGNVSPRRFVQSTYQLFFDSHIRYSQEDIPPIFYASHHGKHVKRYKRKVGFLNPRETRFLIARDMLDGNEDVDRDAFAKAEDASSFKSVLQTVQSNYIREITKRLRE